MTRFQLVFRRDGKPDDVEQRYNDEDGEPRINGVLVVDGQTYTIRGRRVASPSRRPGRQLALRLHARGGAHRDVILAGAPVRKENVELLATMLDGELAAKLRRAVQNDNSIVALSIADREQIVTALADRPSQFVELRTVLVAQLAKHRKHEAQTRGMTRARPAHERDQRPRER